MRIETRQHGPETLASVPTMANAVAVAETKGEAVAGAVREALSALLEHFCLATVTVRDTGGVEIHWPTIEGVTEEPVGVFIRCRDGGPSV